MTNSNDGTPRQKQSTGSLATHRFVAHDALLVSVMREQAGTLAKAIQEGIMNSIDAGANRIDVRVTGACVEIVDDGRGFASEEEILSCFRVFGLPQAAQEQMSKVYGHFRMGRGQLFHFGRNLWKTNVFSMLTDLDARGLDFDVQQGLDPAQTGCHIRIDLYERHHLLPTEIGELEREVTRAIRYAPAKILVNGRLASREPEREKWDVVTDNAWIRFHESGTLDIYNQGVLVESKPGREFGVGGIVVSKHRLKVNFARNMVMAGECPVWRRIRATIRELTDTRIRTRNERLTPEQRDMLAGRIAAGESVQNATDLHLITDVSRIDWTLKRLVAHCRKHNIVQMVEAPASDRRGDVLHQEGRAFVIHGTTLERFACESVREFLDLLLDRGLWPRHELVLRPGTLDEPHLHVETEYRIVKPDQVTPLERVILDHVQREHRWPLLGEGYFGERAQERQIVLGESPHALAWTDGSSFIAIERRLLKRLDTLEGWFSLSLQLASQYASEIDTAGAYEHGPEYYTRFHNLALTRCPAFAALAAGGFSQRLRSLGRRLSKRVLKMEDKAVTLRRDWEFAGGGTNSGGTDASPQHSADIADEGQDTAFPIFLTDDPPGEPN